MFQVGQTVYHKSGSHFGKVLEIDQDIVYLEQRNGVEVDFPLKDVQATDPRIVAKAEIVDKNTFTKEDFSEENQAVFDAIPENIKKTTEVLYNRIPFRSGEWKDLHDAQKMNLILKSMLISIALRYAKNMVN